MASLHGRATPARVDTYAFAPRLRHRRASAGCALSQIGNVGPDLGQSYIVDSVHGGGDGRRRPARRHRLSRRWAWASSTSSSRAGPARCSAKIAVLVFIIIFIQKRPQGIFALKGRSAEGPEHRRRCAPPPAPLHLQRPPLGWPRARFRAAWSRVVLCCALRCSTSLVPAGQPLHVSDYAVTLVGKIMCYGICALAMDLIWGYTGILSASATACSSRWAATRMGMYLMRQIGRDGDYKSDLPDFMVFLDWKTLPWYWTFSDSFLSRAAAGGARCRAWSPSCSASSLSARASRACTSRSSRRRMTFAAMLLFFRNETGFGGNNGFTDFKRILGIPIPRAGHATLFVLAHLRGTCWASSCVPRSG